MSTRRQFGVWAVALVVLALVLVVTSLTRETGDGSGDESVSGSDAQGDSQSDARGTGIDLARHEPGDRLAVGDEDAPVVLVEYADFRCPFCGIFARETKPKLMQYVEDGTVRMEWHDLPVFGEQSLDAAVAGRAAAKQGRFWQFYQATFDDAPERGHLALPRTKLVALAEEAGVPDLAQFEADLDSEKLLAQVKSDAHKAREVGASGTPLFFVNDEPIMGAQPVDVFENAIKRQVQLSSEDQH